jgi:hypothetical protein
MGPKQTLLAVSLGWGLIEAAVLVVHFTFVSNGGKFGLFSFPDTFRAKDYIRISFFLEASIPIMAVLGGYILADFLESFKALLISHVVASMAAFAGTIISYSALTGTFGPVTVYAGLFIVLFIYFNVGLLFALLGALLGVLMESRTPYCTDSRFVTLGLILNTAAVLPTLVLPRTPPPWIVFPMIPLILFGFVLTYYGQMRVRMLKARMAGLLFITAIVAMGLSAVSFLIWTGLYEECTMRNDCLYPATDISYLVWASLAALVVPGFVLLGNFFPKDWSSKMESATPGKESNSDRGSSTLYSGRRKDRFAGPSL